MINLDQFKTALDKKDLTTEQKKQLTDLITPFFDFKEFMMNKLSITEEQLEEMSKVYSEKRFLEFTDHFSKIMSDPDSKISPIQESIVITAKIYGDFGKEHGYEKHKDLETSLGVYLELMLMEEFQGMYNTPQEKTEE